MIDPIPIKEALQRINEESHLLRRKTEGGQALQWFSEFALSKSGGPRTPLSDVLENKLRPVATSTPNAKEAEIYLSRAFREMHRAIIERAIEIAKEDFETGKAIR